MILKKAIQGFLILSLFASGIPLSNFLQTSFPYGSALIDQPSFTYMDGPPQQNILWHRTYGGPNSDSSQAIQCSNGDYALYGHSDNKALLLRTTEDGEYLWHQIFNEYTVLTDIVETENNDLVLLLRKCSFITLPYIENFMLLKTDSNGNQLWNRTYEDIIFNIPYAWSQHFFHSLELCSDGGFVIGGNLEYLMLGEHYGPWLLRTDSFGVPLWNYSYLPISGQLPCLSYKMIQCHDGGFAFAGFNPLYDTPFLLRIDSFGAVSWVQEYSFNDTFVFHLIETKDRRFVCVGSTYNSTFNDFDDIFIMKTNSQGILLWNKTYETISRDRAAYVLETQENKLAIVGGINTTTQEDLLLLVTDSEGNREWNITLGGFGSDFGKSVIELPNGDFVISGGTDSFGAGNSDCWLLQAREGYSPLPPNLPNPIFWYFILVVIIMIVIVIGLFSIKFRKRQTNLGK